MIEREIALHIIQNKLGRKTPPEINRAVKVDRELGTLRSGNAAGLVAILPLVNIERVVFRAMHGHQHHTLDYY